MEDIAVIERDMTSAELERMNAGFDENTVDNAVAIQTSDRIGFVAMDGERFIGCASGLAHKNGSEFSGWFYLTDLFVEKEYRRRGIGAALLGSLEERLRTRRIHRIWTWTAGYEAPGFYERQGYSAFAELESWYSNGCSRIAYRKEIEP